MCKSVINAISFAGGGGGSVATGVLQIAGGVAIDATLRAVEDQNGTDSMLQLSNAAVNIGSGTITNNGMLTIKGAGGNIASFRNSSNVEKAWIENTGRIQSIDEVTGSFFRSTQTSVGFYLQSIGFIRSGGASGKICLTNNADTSFDMLQFGGTSLAEPAIQKVSGQLQFVYADGTTGYTGFAVGEGTKKGISVIKGATNTPYLGFFGAAEIAQPTTAIAEAAFVSGGAGTNIKTDDTFGGYTLQQIAQALTNLGFLG